MHAYHTSWNLVVRIRREACGFSKGHKVASAWYSPFKITSKQLNNQKMNLLFQVGYWSS